MDLGTLKMMEAVFKEYRTLDCSCCNEMLGYMHRKSGTLYCSGSCLTEGQTNNSCSMPTVPSSQLTPQQIQKVVSHIPDTEINGFKDERRAHVKSVAEDRVDGSARFSKPISQSAESEVKTAPQKSVHPDPEPPKPVRPEPPFTKKPAKTMVAPEENPFKKSQDANKIAPKSMVADVKTPRPAVTQMEPEENPFKKAQPTTTSKISSRPPADEGDLEQNPFKKSQAPKNMVAEVSGVSKTPRPTVAETVPEENPFKKAQTTTASKKPSRPTVDLDDVEENPFVSSSKARKPEPKKESVREIEIVLNPIATRLRSALPWAPDADKHLDLILLGGKSNDNGPSDFCFQSVGMAAKALALQKDIETFSRTATAIPLKRLELGTLVFAPFCGETFRGEIIGIVSKETAEVYFVDYGNTQELSIKEISKLPKEFQDIPRLCFHCQWDLWLTRDNKAAVEDAVTARYHSTEAKGLMPLRKLCDGQYLVAIGTPVQNVNFTVKECPKFDKVAVGGPEEVEEKEAPKPQPPKPKVLRKKYWFKDCAYSPSLVDGCLVKLAYVWGFTKFMAVSVDDETPLNEVQALVLKCAADPKNQLKERPDVQEVVLAPYQGDYYRARVVELPEDPNTVKVLFFDYGDQDIVKVTDLFQPSMEIIQHPVYAMNVDLHGLKNETTRPKLSAHVNEVLGLPLQLQIMKKPDLDDPNSDHVFDVTLWNEDTSLNKLMKQAFETAKEHKMSTADAETKYYSYLDSLAMSDEYCRSTLETFKESQTSLMIEKAIKDNVPLTYEWSSLDTQFDYFLDDLPFQSLKGDVNVKVVKYRRLDAITVLPLGEKYDRMKDSVSEDIAEYISTVDWDRDFVPQKKQVCLVKMPTLANCKEYYTKVMGIKKYQRNQRKLSYPELHLAGKWFRGLYVCRFGEYWMVNLFDVGLELPVPKRSVYKSPLWFVIAPMQCSTLVILWLELAQLTRLMELAINTFLIEGTILKVKVVTEYDDLTMARLLYPPEKTVIETALLRYQAQEVRELKEKDKSKNVDLAKWFTNPVTKTLEPPGLAPTRFHINLESSDDEFEELVEQNQGFNKWTKIQEQVKLRNSRFQESLYRHVADVTNSLVRT